ncbi:MAG: hypothetical protein WCB12_05625 [Bryobacteraceae bacterium]
MCGAAIALVWSASSARADEWDKRTVLTVNQPIQVKDRLLEPGTYVFRLLDTKSDRHTVQIFNGDQSRIIDTVFAIPRYRLQPAGRSEFAFWETPPGTARALRAWFYPGDTIGLEFTYPKHPVVLTASLNTQTGPSVTPPPAEAAPAPEPAAQYEPEAVEPAPEPQANPEPQPAAQETAPAPAPEPAALPKTASPFPPDRYSRLPGSQPLCLAAVETNDVASMETRS